LTVPTCWNCGCASVAVLEAQAAIGQLSVLVVEEGIDGPL
jgi:hypothetical protein